MILKKIEIVLTFVFKLMFFLTNLIESPFTLIIYLNAECLIT